MRTKWSLRRIISAAVAAGMTSLILLQFWLLVTEFILPINSRIRTVRTVPAVERGAYIGFGDEFAENVSFTRSQVPQDARVVIPPISISATYGNQGIMQFFLFPRSIVNCPEVEEAGACLQTFKGRDTYFLAVLGFPENVSGVENRELLMTNESFGVYLPYGSAGSSDSDLK